MPGIRLSGGNADPNALAVGEATLSRTLAAGSVGMTSGAMRLTYFTAGKTELVSNVRVLTTGSAAAATPTVCRVGVYSVAANGSLTLVGATANDTTLFAAANTAYTRALTTPFTKVAGRRYAVGVLVVSGAAVPTVSCFAFSAGSATLEMALAPMLAGSVGGPDLPSSVAAGDVTASSFAIYAALTP